MDAGTIEAEQPELLALRKEANALYEAGRFGQARKLYRQGLVKAEVSGVRRSRASFAVGLANCDLQSFEFKSAIGHYGEARKFAASQGDWALAGVSAFNSHLAYSRMGDMESASSALRDAVHWLSRGAAPAVSGRVVAQIARAAGVEGLPAAEPLFHKALVALQEDGNPRLLKNAWTQYGRFLLDMNRPKHAELAFEEALRLASGSAERVVILYGLAEVDRRAGRLAQALIRNESASRLLRTAAAAQLPEWMLLQQRALLLAQQGNAAQALQLFETALDSTFQFRRSVRWNPNAGLTGEAFLHQLYSSYLDFISELPRTPRYAAERRRALLLSEYSKALTLGEQLQHSPPRTAEFQDALAKLHKAEAKVLESEGNKSERSSQFHLQIRQLELVLSSTSGIHPEERKEENNSSGFSLPYIQRELGDDQALFSFHTSAWRSTVWAVTRNKVEVSNFVDQVQLGSKIRAFTEAIRARNPERLRSLGGVLYRQIFGSFSRDVLAKAHWVLSVDQQLFELPFAALTAEGGEFVIEKHSLRLIPGVRLMLAENAAPPPPSLVAYGDAVYNAADPRRSPPTGWRFRLPDVLAGDRRPSLELPRLPGSAAEAHLAAATVPQFQNVVLTGKTASRKELIRSIREGTGIFHFAGHVMQSEQRPELVMMALGLDEGGAQDFLSPSEVATFRMPLGLVVLSGCSSGRGKTLPGAGLLGMTRSWLIAGAQAVAAALWPTTDDVGEFFRFFYSSLVPGSSAAKAGITSAGAAKALQQAQVRMLRSGSWRSAPDYWAPYIVFGRD